MTTESPKIIPAVSAKRSAQIFHWGNILAALIPLPIFVLWIAASILVYAFLKHHPNKRVGYYTQQGAYYYYAMVGLMIPLLTFASRDFFKDYWWAIWLVIALVLIPLSLRQILKIRKEDWQDTKTVLE